MNKFALATLVLAIAAVTTATNNIPSYFFKQAPVPAYRNPAVYVPPPQVPATYRYDVRFNPLKYSYAPPAPVPVYAVPPEYAVPQPVPAYVPAPAPLPAPAPVPYIPPQVYGNVPPHAHHFIGRHFPHPHYH